MRRIGPMTREVRSNIERTQAILLLVTWEQRPECRPGQTAFPNPASVAKIDQSGESFRYGRMIELTWELEPSESRSRRSNDRFVYSSSDRATRKTIAYRGSSVRRAEVVKGPATRSADNGEKCDRSVPGSDADQDAKAEEEVTCRRIFNRRWV
jgi:hypothetical protein